MHHLGTFAGALEARHIPAGPEQIWADVTGEIDLDGKVLVVKRIAVTYHLVADEMQRETIARVLASHADACPMARTIGGCVQITTRLALNA